MRNEFVTYHITCQSCKLHAAAVFVGERALSEHTCAFRNNEHLDTPLTASPPPSGSSLFFYCCQRESFYVILTSRLTFAVNLALLQEAIVGLIAADVIVKIVCN